MQPLAVTATSCAGAEIFPAPGICTACHSGRCGCRPGIPHEEFPPMRHHILRPLAAATLAACTTWAAHAQQVQTVFYIAMENTNWTQPAGQSIQQIYGNSAAPWLNALVNGTLSATVNGQTITSQTAYASAYHNVLATPTGANPSIHPSEPNYLWTEGGTN
jgi:hypothetical protein